jgi:hypothetical protein
LNLFHDLVVILFNYHSLNGQLEVVKEHLHHLEVLVEPP